MQSTVSVTSAPELWWWGAIVSFAD